VNQSAAIPKALDIDLQLRRRGERCGGKHEDDHRPGYRAAGRDAIWYLGGVVG
jgi:hypothetical protein